ncbi:hypothetical protein Efla_001359 [Eimeria flavescens]
MDAAEADQPAAAGASGGERVRVVIRCRPLTESEVTEGRKSVLIANSKNATVCLQKPNGPAKHFTFDAVYDETVLQACVYDDAAFSIVESVAEGYNAHESCCVQTFLVRASFLELYNEEARDLLSKTPSTKLNLRDSPVSGVYAEGLSTFAVKSASDLTKLLAAGQRNRKVGATLMNAASSRSHSIFTLAVESADLNGRVRMGKLNLVDLAGSERSTKAGSTGDRLREAMKINLSLSALGNVIFALAEQSPFVPYRDSKLTRILQASLGGNTKTAMVANVGPACVHYDETLSTLRYAQRAKHIKNSPQVNEDPKQAAILAFQEEIARLKQQLQTSEQARLQALLKPEETVKEIFIEKPVIIQKEVVLEKPTIVEKIVEKIKIVDVSEEEKRKIEERNLERQRHLRETFEIEKSAIETARRKAEESLKAKELQASLYERHQAELAARLQQMEAQLLRGNAEIARAKQQQRELKKTQLRLEERHKMEEQLRRERDQGREARQLLESLVSSKEKQVKGLSSTVQQLCRRYTEVVDDMEDIQREFQAEREELLSDIRSLQVELRLHQLIISHFVPPEEMARMRAHATWDELQGDWVLPYAELAGNAQPLQRPFTKGFSTKRRPKGLHGSGTRWAEAGNQQFEM